jgi:hypothetical protein
MQNEWCKNALRRVKQNNPRYVSMADLSSIGFGWLYYSMV